MSFRIYMLLVIILCGGLAPAAFSSFAEASTPSWNQQALKWRTECDNQKIIVPFGNNSDRITQFVKDLAFDGLKVIASVNPTFADHLLSEMESRNLLIDCHGFTTFEAETAGTSVTIGQPLYDYIYTDRTTLPRGLLDKIRTFHTPTSWRGFSETRKFTERNFLKQDARNTIFHELLHFAKADNNFHSVHNNLPHQKQNLDLVYSCSDLAFPSPYEDWFKYCVTCALARWNSFFLNSIATGNGNYQAATKACEAIYPAREKELEKTLSKI